MTTRPLPATEVPTVTVRVPQRTWDIVRECAAVDQRKLGAELAVLVEAGATALGHDLRKPIRPRSKP